MNATVTLIGYLGKDPEIRDTEERTFTQKTLGQQLIFEHRGARTLDRDCDIAEAAPEYDVTVPSREYAVFSLATHGWEGKKRITTWHRVVVWNADRLEFLGLRIARKGSRVEVTGPRKSFETRDGGTIKQIEASSVRLLQLK